MYVVNIKQGRDICKFMEYYSNMVLKEGITKYIENQRHFVELAKKSTVPTMIINTDDLNWDGYARMILNKIH